MKFLLAIFICSLLSCSKNENIKEFSKEDNAYFKAIIQNDVELDIPKEGDWLFDHKEPGQLFDKYKIQKTLKPNDSLATIYLKPIGNFDSLQKKVLQLTTEFVSICFGSKAILLPIEVDSLVNKKYKRIRQDGNTQILASYVLDSLVLNKFPKDGLVCMALTQKDLFPKPEWNFVFGLAYYNRGCAVSSIYRLENRTHNNPRFEIFLKRLMSISTHEIGHMFGIQHCTKALCTMNGSNSLRETDKQPNRFCSECQKKLTFNFKYNNKERLQKMLKFFKENNLMTDYNLIAKDYKDSFSH